ncbi:hypothetical protein, partial [Pseudomonas sp.]|uniref:hypothetical protein n=1 Tax=Pseudomonas sp. TaxID=306 RepID=UPI003F9BCD7F
IGSWSSRSPVFDAPITLLRHPKSCSLNCQFFQTEKLVAPSKPPKQLTPNAAASLPAEVHLKNHIDPNPVCLLRRLL